MDHEKLNSQLDALAEPFIGRINELEQSISHKDQELIILRHAVAQLTAQLKAKTAKPTGGRK